MDVNMRKHAGENDHQYIWRLASAKDAGILEMSWSELGTIFNEELRGEDEPWWDESAYRKAYQYAKTFYDEVFADMIGNDYSELLKNQYDELYKLKRQLSDQRREYNKQLTVDARADHLLEVISETAAKMPEFPQIQKRDGYQLYGDRTEAVLALADWHYGMVTDNLWNQYNIEICRERVSKLLDDVSEALLRHQPDVLHIVLLGDMAHGAIHTSARVAAEEDTCDQIIHVAELLSQLIASLSHYAGTVKVYSTYGNHLRTIQNKKESVHTDNMEKIIPWWIKERLAAYNNIQVIDSEYKEFIRLNVCGYNIVCTHGDLDILKNVGVTFNTLFTKLYGETVDYTLTADKHHLEEFESFNIENILVRSLCGIDNYANERRLYSNAGQTLLIFNERDGRNCTYNVNLQKLH